MRLSRATPEVDARWAGVGDLLASLAERGPGGSGASSLVDDCQAVLESLTTSLCGRPPVSSRDAAALARIGAGVLPVGFDGVIEALAAADPEQAITAHQFAMAPGSPAEVTVAAETLVGSLKANGAPTANEDVVSWARRGPQTLVVLCDGITGPGDGSGYRAAHAALETTLGVWSGGGDLEGALATADEVAEATGGGATLVAVEVEPSQGRAKVLSLGDSGAWLLRSDGGACLGFRLCPVDTLHASNLIEDPEAWGFESVLTRYLGGGGDQPHITEITTCPGDLIVVCSDGVEIDEPQDPFLSILPRLATEVRGANVPLAPVLAVELVTRAEWLSGRDNATAAVIAFGSPSQDADIAPPGIAPPGIPPPGIPLPDIPAPDIPAPHVPVKEEKP